MCVCMCVCVCVCVCVCEGYGFLNDLYSLDFYKDEFYTKKSSILIIFFITFKRNNIDIFINSALWCIL